MSQSFSSSGVEWAAWTILVGTLGSETTVDAIGTVSWEVDVLAALDLAAMNSFASASVLSFLYSAPVKPLT